MRRRPLVYSVIAIGAMALFVLAGFLRPLREVFRAALLPVARVASNAGEAVGRALHLAPDVRAANERAEELDARLRALTVDYVRLRALEEENKELLAQAEFISSHSFQMLGARVISRTMTDTSAAVTIDRGSRDGIEIGEAVVTGEGIYAGKIVSLGERTSIVKLVSDVSARAAATVAGNARIAGVVEGRGNGVARFTLIPQDLELKRDDVIVTAGTEEKVPGNLTIGLVDDVESAPTDPFKNAAIEPLAPLGRLELVSVIIPGE
jgi:rod shape-determining protein MreC